MRCRLTMPEPTLLAMSESITFGPVHLDVTDRARSLRWWRDVAGLEDIREDNGSVELGVGSETLIVLRERARRPVDQGHTGLYHLAINVPDEPAFAQTLARLMDSAVPHGTTDHLVAKSIYLADPDGLGLELAVETPERVASVRWPEDARHPEIIDAEGRSRQGLEVLDVDAALAKLPGGELPRALPSQTRVGHVHLKVADLPSAYAFYRDRLGFIASNWAPLIGYGDLGTGDFRVHRVAVNTWQGAGLPPRPPEMAGMDHYTVRVESPQRLNEVLGRLDDVRQEGDTYFTHDPSGNAIALEAQ